ncbi:unnamed protein product [Caenorhabditis nigoni]
MSLFMFTDYNHLSTKCSNKETETRVKSRKASLTPVNQEFSSPADENSTVDQASVTPSSDAFSGSRTRMPMSTCHQKSIANAENIVAKCTWPTFYHSEQRIHKRTWAAKKTSSINGKCRSRSISSWDFNSAGINRIFNGS